MRTLVQTVSCTYIMVLEAALDDYDGRVELISPGSENSYWFVEWPESVGATVLPVCSGKRSL